MTHVDRVGRSTYKLTWFPFRLLMALLKLKSKQSYLNSQGIFYLKIFIFFSLDRLDVVKFHGFE